MDIIVVFISMFRYFYVCHFEQSEKSFIMSQNKISLFSRDDSPQPYFGTYSQVDRVYNYIENQEKHHKKRTFQEEYIGLLDKFGIEYDEKYLFRFFSRK